MWKIIQDSPNFEVSDSGEIRHIKFKRVRKLRTHQGYSYITLAKKVYQVHRLVAKAFLENYSEDKQVDHINRVRTDNRVINLRMVTNHQNLLNKIKEVGIVEHIISLHEQGYSADSIREVVG